MHKIDPENMTVNIEYNLPEMYHGQEIEVEILGGFSEWCPIGMIKDLNDPNKFTHEVKLKRGYKHR